MSQLTIEQQSEMYKQDEYNPHGCGRLMLIVVFILAMIGAFLFVNSCSKPVYTYRFRYDQWNRIDLKYDKAGMSFYYDTTGAIYNDAPGSWPAFWINPDLPEAKKTSVKIKSIK